MDESENNTHAYFHQGSFKSEAAMSDDLNSTALSSKRNGKLLDKNEMKA